MRCKNCHTVMMDTDTHCPSCRSSVERATAAAPGEIAAKPNGLLMALPVFGGAIGGLAYAALTTAQTGAPSYAGPPARPSEASGPSSVRWLVGLLLMLGGGLFVVLAFMHAVDTWEIARREPKAVTAAELCRQDYPASAPSWIAYTFAESKPTGPTVTRSRLGRGGEVQARCLLVRVEDHWLAATVAPGFEGNRLVGRLVPVDTPVSHAFIERLRNQESPPIAVLPYEFSAVDGCASDQRVRYMAAGWAALFGVGGLSLGVHLFRGGRGTAQNVAGPASTGWSYQAPK